MRVQSTLSFYHRPGELVGSHCSPWGWKWSHRLLTQSKFTPFTVITVSPKQEDRDTGVRFSRRSPRASHVVMVSDNKKHLFDLPVSKPVKWAAYAL